MTVAGFARKAENLVKIMENVVKCIICVAKLILCAGKFMFFTEKSCGNLAGSFFCRTFASLLKTKYYRRCL